MLLLRLLGGLSLSMNGSRLTGPATQRHRLALLALLAGTRSRRQSRDRLVAWLWPERDIEHARNLLNQGVHALRRAIRETAIISDQNDLRLDPLACACDVVAFEDAVAAGELERAITVYTGPFLDGFHLPGASEFERWVTGERERLRRMYTRSLERLAESAEEQREWRTAAERWSTLLAEEPYDARATLRLMRARARGGDRAGALREAQRHAQVLHDEFETAPDPEVVAFADHLRHAVSGARDAARIATDDGSRATPVASSATIDAPSLVGRTVEWKELMREWQAAKCGLPRCLLISGVAGIGKTCLIEEFVRWTDGSDAATATARCYGTVGRLPYAPLADWLRAPSLRESVLTLPEVWRAELAELLPELAHGGADAGARRDVPRIEARRRFFEATVRAIADAPHPLLLVLDDIQWADRDTLEWIRYLLRCPEPLRVLVVATLRLGEVPLEQRLDDVLLDLRRNGRLREILLEPLDVADTATLGAAITGAMLEPAEARALHVETEGHPLYIVESMRANAVRLDGAPPPAATSGSRAASSGMRQPLPERVLATIEARLAQLSAPCRGIVGVAAVIGREFRLDLLSEASAIDEDGVAAALEELLARRLVRERGDGVYDFGHANIREVAYAGVSSARRRLLHQRIARALMETASETSDAAAAIARHLEEGGKREAAIQYHERAAEVAKRMYASEEAIDHLYRALTLLATLPESAARDRRELALQIALGPPLQESRGWAAPELGVMTTRAGVLSERIGTARERLRVMWESATFRIVRGSGLQEALAIAEEALHLALAQGDPELLVPAHHLLGEILCHMGEFERARESLEWAADRHDPREHATNARLLGVDYGVFSPSIASHALWHVGRFDEAFARSRQAQERSEERADPFSRVIAQAYGAMLQQFAGDVDAVESMATSVIAVSTQYRFPYYRAWGGMLHGWAMAQRGESERGIAQIRDHLAAMRATGCDYRRSYWLSLLAEVCGRAGRIEEGLDLVTEAFAAQEVSGEHWKHADLHRLRGEFLAASGATAAEVRRHLLPATDAAARQVRQRTPRPP